MGYLTLTRREGEQIRLTIDSGVDTGELLQRLLHEGITIYVSKIGLTQVKISIEAPNNVLVLRGELIAGDLPV